MTSRHDDNFDLYDDPYADTGASTGSDPYQDDDDTLYNTTSSHSHRSSDLSRHREDSLSKGHDDSHYSNSRRDYDDDSRYANNSGRDDNHNYKREDSAKREDSPSGGYDPAQPYHQQHDSSYQQQAKRESSQPSRSYGSYDQEDRSDPYSQQQQQQQQQQHQQPSSSSSSSANRELGKMFIGGLNWETTDASLSEYFSRYGELSECMVMKDPVTNKSRGFGFLTFADAKNVDAVLKEDHHLDGKMIDPKRAIPREEQEKTEKIFVGGIAPEVTEEEFANYFSQFGHVLDATLMLDRNTGRPRGFGFITFESDRGVEAALSRRDLVLHHKTIEVKRAQPKNRAEGRGANGAGGAGAGFNQQGYGFGAGQGGMRNFGMDPTMMAAAYGGGFGVGNQMEAYQAMMAAARYNPAAAAMMMNRLRMAGAYGNPAAAAGMGGPGMGMDPAMMAFHRQQFGYGGPNQGGANGGGGDGGSSGGGSQGRQSGYNNSNSQGGSGNRGNNSSYNGDSGNSGSGNGYSGSSGKYDDHDGGSSSGQRRYGSQSDRSYGQESGSHQGGGGGGSGGYSSSRGSGPASSSGSRQGGSNGSSGSGGPVRGGNSGGNSQSSSGRGGGSYHPYQR
ncbi:hypothetical protein EMPS_00884 [Entomortierella parvispora]|uniref:RRM domain-containing protein n=1 Tax=Entomortierella parvispora TaxID=205924 RepID=A0A9P3H1T1_9FUNG|nr:hypothetical protein EMPS_00884 [Entomortierella parvispora]